MLSAPLGQLGGGGEWTVGKGGCPGIKVGVESREERSQDAGSEGEIRPG